jgi:hypothetical protein
MIGVRSRRFLALSWGLATLIGLVVARVTKVGPVLVIFAPDHGLHAGDVVTFGICYLVALAASLRIVRRRSLPARTRLT